MSVSMIRFGYGQPTPQQQKTAVRRTADVRPSGSGAVIRPRFGNGGNPLDDLRTVVEQLRKDLAAQKQRNDLSALMQRVVPATVSLRVKQTIKNFDKIADRIRRMIGLPPNVSLNMGKEQNGFGSGFWIMCKDGKPRIVTNAHVARPGGSEKEVLLQTPAGVVPASLEFDYEHEGDLNFYRTADRAAKNEKPVTIKLKLATSPVTGDPAIIKGYDLAVLEPVDAGFYIPDNGKFKLPDGIEPLEMETDIAANQPGDRVLKVGNSAGVQGNAADGLISAFRYQEICPCGGAHHKDDKEFMVVETAAAVNPGDSGGPLVNLDGKVIGVNYQKVAATGHDAASSIDAVGRAIAAPVVRKQMEEWGFL